MKTGYAASFEFKRIKPRGKKARREQRKAWDLFHGSTRLGNLRYTIESRTPRGDLKSFTGTLEELRPHLKKLGMIHLPGDGPLIHNGRKAR